MSSTVPVPKPGMTGSTVVNRHLILKLFEIPLIAIGIACIVCIIYAILKSKKKINALLENEKDVKTRTEKIIEIKRIRDLKIILYGIGAFVTFFIQQVLNIISNTALKPIIYIYPQKDREEINIKLNKTENLTCTYPKYKDEWNVIANKNGDLLDKETGKHYYALYWEGIDYGKEKFNDGFIVKGENTSAFLEEKLAILGLNERESEEFIIYWLPILEKSAYNLIRFKTKQEIDQIMKLDITPKPDMVIRVLMTFKPLKKKIDIKEQVLEPIKRKGFTVVEWGGIIQK